MDPVGPQKKIKGSDQAVHRQKLLDQSPKQDMGMLTGRGTRAADKLGSVNEKFQGTTKGKTKHTYQAGD